MTDKKRIKSLKKYIKPSNSLTALGVWFAFLGVSLLIHEIVAGIENDGIEFEGFWIAVIFTLFAFLLIELGITGNKRLKKLYTDIEESGGLPLLLDDFENGGKAFKNKLVLGQRFLIGKNTGVVIAYSDIGRIYQEIHKTNYIEDSRTLKILSVKTNRYYDLCKIPLKGKADDEVQQVIEYIVSMNPNIRVGYK